MNLGLESWEKSSNGSGAQENSVFDSLPARLSHYEGEGRRRNEGKNPQRSWTERWKGKEERTGEQRAGIRGTEEMANQVNGDMGRVLSSTWAEHPVELRVAQTRVQAIPKCPQCRGQGWGVGQPC